MAHLSSQKSCQVDLRDHLAATITFLLVSVLMVLYQVPDLHPALQIRSNHGGAGAHAVWASSVLDHVLCGKTRWFHSFHAGTSDKNHKVEEPHCLLPGSAYPPTSRHRPNRRLERNLHVSVKTALWPKACVWLTWQIGYETFRKSAWLIFHSFFSSWQNILLAADRKSNRRQTRWNMYGPPSGQSGNDISKHMAQWMFTQCEKKLISGCGRRGVWFLHWQKSICPERRATRLYGGT